MLTTEQRHEAVQDNVVIAEVLALLASNGGGNPPTRGRALSGSIYALLAVRVDYDVAANVIRAVDKLEAAPRSAEARALVDDWIAYALGLRRTAPAGV